MHAVNKSTTWTTSHLSVTRTHDIDNGNINNVSNIEVGGIQFRTVSGFSNPGYRQMIAAGQNANTPYSRTSMEIEKCDALTYTGSRVHPGHLFDYPQPETLYRLISMAFQPPDAFDISTAYADNVARGRMISRILSTQQRLAGGVALGELGETIRGITHPAQAIRKLCSSYLDTVKKRARKARRKHGRMYSVDDPSVRKDVQEAVSGSWLEFAFGIKPTLSDVRSAAEALASLTAEHQSNQRVSAQAKDTSYTSLGDFTFVAVAGWAPLSGWRKLITQATVRYTAGIRVPLPSLNVAKTFGVSWDDFVPTVWELMPFSFLADYFGNIGDMLNYLSILNANLVYLTKSVKKRRECISGPRTPVYPDPNGYLDYKLTCSGGFAQMSSVIYERAADSVSGLAPSFQFEVPGCDTRWINIAALVAQGEAATRYAVRG